MTSGDYQGAPWTFANLDPETRPWMLAELEQDILNGRGYKSRFLTSHGKAIYESLLRDALRDGDPESLMLALEAPGVLAEEARPNTAHESSGGRFNRYYMRGLCRRVLNDDENGEVLGDRARDSKKKRDLSDPLVGQSFSARVLLEELRATDVGETASGFGGPGSGISLKLP